VMQAMISGKHTGALLHRAQSIDEMQGLIQFAMGNARVLPQTIYRTVGRAVFDERFVQLYRFGRIHTLRFPGQAGALPNSLSPIITKTGR
jgi:hypothetical protein